MVYACVAYDISSNRLRLRVSKWCKKAGLLRLQKSVFVGPLPADTLALLEREARALLPATDRLAVFRLDAANFQALLRQTPDERLAALNKPAAYWNY